MRRIYRITEGSNHQDTKKRTIYPQMAQMQIRNGKSKSLL